MDKLVLYSAEHMRLIERNRDAASSNGKPFRKAKGTSKKVGTFSTIIVRPRKKHKAWCPEAPRPRLAEAHLKAIWDKKMLKFGVFPQKGD